MTTSNYMPAITVQIAWDGGFRIPMADWTWTDVSDYVELKDGINGSWGRGDERSTADANTVTLTFDNSDGRFTAARSTSPYYPNVKLYKPIRVLADPVDGAEMPLFTGYITSWPVEWEDTSAYAKATITATSRLARLGLNARWRSLVEETILADGPVAYYPMGDPEGSMTASEASGRGEQPLRLFGAGDPVVFGQATGPGTDDLTAATFAGGMYLFTGLASEAGAGQSAECFMLTEAAPAAQVVIVRYRDTELIVTTAGRARVAISGASVNGTVNICDGATHHVAATHDGTTLRLFVDGVADGTASAAFAPSPGDLVSAGYDQRSAAAVFSGTLSHVAGFDSAPSPTRITAHAAAGSDGFAGEPTDDRFIRYAEMAGIPAAEVAAEAGSTTMVHVDTTGQNVVDLLRITEATEAGVLFDALDGTLTLHSRSHRYAAASVLTLDMALHEVEADYSPRLDPSSLVNDITVTGVVSARAVDAASVEAYGSATASLSTASEDDDEPLNLASWARLQFAEPRPRVPSLSVDALAQVGKTVTCADVMAVTLGDKITVANHPSQASVSIVDYFIEGGSFSIGPESFRLTWNVSPSYPYDSVFILDDPVYGVLDGYPLAL